MRADLEKPYIHETLHSNQQDVNLESGSVNHLTTHTSYFEIVYFDKHFVYSNKHVVYHQMTVFAVMASYKLIRVHNIRH